MNFQHRILEQLEICLAKVEKECANNRFARVSKFLAEPEDVSPATIIELLVTAMKKFHIKQDTTHAQQDL